MILQNNILALTVIYVEIVITWSVSWNKTKNMTLISVFSLKIGFIRVCCIYPALGQSQKPFYTGNNVSFDKFIVYIDFTQNFEILYQ